MKTNLRRRVASSPFGRGAALPTRTMAVARYDARLIGRSIDWLVHERERHNFSYDLEDRNLEQLAWFVAAVTGAEIGQVRAWMEELEKDEDLIKALTERLSANPFRSVQPTEPHWGRRAGWYALIRATEPELVVETGTHMGLGSCIIAAALLRNGHGRLTTIDVDSDSGYLITEPWASVVDSRIGSSVDELASLRDVGMFLHDSLFTYDFETAELAAVAPNLLPGAIVLSDNARCNPGVSALSDWAERTGRHYLYFKEQPRDHWWPGDGVGAAWAQVRAK